MITNSFAMWLAKRAIKVHGPKIVSSLEIDPSILDRIYVSERIDAEGAAVMRHRGYVVECVEMYPITSFYNEDKHLWFTRLLLPLLPFLYMQFIFQLAHELRHVHQYETRDPRCARINYEVGSMLYQISWVERDANEYARNYLKKLFSIKSKSSN